MSVQDPKATAKIGRALAIVDDLTARLAAVVKLTTFLAGSRAAGDTSLSTLIGAAPPQEGGALASSSLDHLLTWRHTLTSGLQPTYAHMTLLRGAMEAAVVARWLVDPDAGPKERVARAAAWLRESYLTRRRVETTLGVPVIPPAQPANDRLADLGREVGSLRLPARPVPKMTTLFRWPT